MQLGFGHRHLGSHRVPYRNSDAAWKYLLEHTVGVLEHVGQIGAARANIAAWSESAQLGGHGSNLRGCVLEGRQSLDPIIPGGHLVFQDFQTRAHHLQRVVRIVTEVAGHAPYLLELAHVGGGDPGEDGAGD